MSSISSKIICSASVALVIIAGLLSYFFIIKHKSTSLDISKQLYTILDKYRVPYDIDKHSIDQSVDITPQAVTGVEQCIKNIEYFVAKNQPINMLAVGFPFKSGNQEKKVLGYLPDMAERKSLEYLQHMLNEIKAIYKPGAKILIFTDGIVFAEFFEIPIANVIAYEKALKLLLLDLPDITLYTSEDMLRSYGLTSVADIIKFIDQYGPSDAQFKADVKEISETALKRFALELDHPHGQLILKKSSLEDITTRLLAREMRLRTYLMQAFPSSEYFRLTVHLSPDVSKKFGIRLSPTSDITPYHGVLVQEADGAWSIRFKKDIDSQQCPLSSELINGVTCYYFKCK